MCECVYDSDINVKIVVTNQLDIYLQTFKKS